MSEANTVVAWIKCDGFQKAEGFVGVANKGYKTAEFNPPEEWHI